MIANLSPRECKVGRRKVHHVGPCSGDLLTEGGQHEHSLHLAAAVEQGAKAVIVAPRMQALYERLCASQGVTLYVLDGDTASKVGGASGAADSDNNGGN